MPELTAEGKVVLLDFWTYTCINCIRTLPYLKAWDERIPRRGARRSSASTRPSSPSRRTPATSSRRSPTTRSGYPVVQDNELGTWDAFGNQFWPAKYLIDADGELRYTHFGEGEYETTEKAIRSLLAEAGAEPRRRRAGRPDAETADRGVRTPETYLGYERAQGFVDAGLPRAGSTTATPDGPPAAERLRLRRRAGGSAPESATAGKQARVCARTSRARRVFLVMGSPAGARPRSRSCSTASRSRTPIAGEDVERLGGRRSRTSASTASSTCPERRRAHTSSTLRFEPGIEGYAFTFG